MTAKEHEKLLAMELELEKVSKNHPDQSSFSSNVVGSLSINLVLREIETGEGGGFTTFKLCTFDDYYHHIIIIIIMIIAIIIIIMFVNAVIIINIIYLSYTSSL